MDITSIKIDYDRGQVTLVVNDPISGLTWGVFPAPEEQGPQREGESDAAYESRLAALVEVLRQRAIDNPAPGAGKPKKEKREIVEYIEGSIPLSDAEAVSEVVGINKGDEKALESFVELRKVELGVPSEEVA